MSNSKNWDVVSRKRVKPMNDGSTPLNKIPKRSATTQQKLISEACKRIYYIPIPVDEYELKPYKAFDYQGSYGIPHRLKLLANIDVQNITVSLNKYLNYKTFTSYSEFCHVDQYLSADEFTRDLLSNKKYDNVVNAIVSYLLDWSDETLDEFITLYPNYESLCVSIKNFKALDCGAYVYDYEGVPVVKTAIKIIKAHFEPKGSSKESFDWLSLLDNKFVQHIKYVYDEVSRGGGGFNPQLISMLEADMDIPFMLPNIDIHTLKDHNNPYSLKFITGEASCCKTTVITKLTELGWKKYSRGDSGSFNKKPENRAAVGNLHAALNYVLTRPDCIGDRSFIDNVLWVFIMPACNPTNGDMVDSLFSFLNANFNEPSIAEYIRHKGIVFVDTLSHKNKERQLKRNESGDSYRSRLDLYPLAQFITYYTVARLFGWKVMCVPYDNDCQIDNTKHKQNIETIIAFFGKPILTGKPFVKFSAPSNSYVFDHAFPKSVGIYK